MDRSFLVDVSRYVSAPIVVVLALLARLALDPILGDSIPFTTFCFAVLIVASQCGRGPALLATGLGAVASARFLLPPRGSWQLRGIENQAGMILYLSIGLGIAWLGGTLRVARRRAEANAEQASRRGEQLRITLASIGDAVLVTDDQGRVISLNPVAETLTGWSDGEARGLPVERVFRIVNEETRREVESPVVKAIREGTSVGLANHTVLIARGGTETAIDDCAAPMKDSGGRMIGVVMVFRDVTARREMEAALRESEDHHRHAVELNPQVPWTADSEGRITDFSARWLAMTGLTREQTLGDGWARVPHPDDLPGLSESWARSVRSGEPYDIEHRIRLASGDFRWMRSRAFPRQDESGAVVKWYGTTEDIDDRKRAEEALQAAHRDLERRVVERTAEVSRANRFLEAILENVQDGIVACDAEGTLTLFNRATSEFHGLPREALPPERWAEHYDLFRPDGETRMPVEEVPLFRALRGEPVRDVEMVIAPRDGRPRRIVLASGQAFRDDRGERLGAVVSMHDISVRKQAEEALRNAHDELERRVAERTAELQRANEALLEADRHRCELLESLRESEGRFRTMAESIPQLAWMARPDGEIFWYNRRWYDYTGTTSEEMMGWGWKSVHDPDTLPSVMERWAESIASGEPFDMVFPLRGADGRYRPFLTRIAPVRGEDGRVAHWFGTNTDISDRRRIEEELRAAKEEAEAANRAKTQFLAVLSHELRTPLNPILLATSSMLERPIPAEELRPTLEMIRQNVNLQARLIDDLLDVMRIVQGKMPLHWEVVDCHRIIDQAIQICRSEVFGGELRLELDLAATHRHLNADPARLHQVFWNLIKNAVKFTPEGGRITIRTRTEPGPGGPRDHLLIEVADTGIGIEPDLLLRIFDPFQQGESTITRKFGGLGLGLAICKGIVDAHGGTIAVSTGGIDQGTTFRLTFQALPEQFVSGVNESHGPGPVARKGDPASLRILVVEDEPATLRLMTRLLRGLGHVVTAADTIATAYLAFAEGEFDLIVSDIGLPDGTGLELMRRVVALRGPLPAIALTGYGMEDDIVRSRQAGFTAHMTKPIDFSKLEAMIRQVVPDRA